MKALSLALFCFLFEISSAQVSLISTGLQAMKCDPYSALTTTWMNAGLNPTEVLCTATLRDGSGNTVFTAKSEPFTIVVGLNTISGISVLSDYRYAETAVGQYIATSNLLPAGNFELCFAWTSQNAEFPGEYCFPIFSSFSSFLQLIFPANKSEIQEPNPMLNWIHSGSIPTQIPGETFELLLTKKETVQSPAQALSLNPLLLNLSDLRSHSIMYPLNAPSLEDGSTYVWQVKRLFQGEVLETTEVWEFTMLEMEDPRDIKYVDVTASKSADIVEVFQSFFFRFDEKYNDAELHVLIQDIEGKIILPETTNDNENTVTAKKNGFNGYRLNLNQLGLKGGYYNLVLTNAKGRQYIIRIHYNK